jgi:hypothetical protein
VRLVFPADRVEVEDARHLGLAGVGELDHQRSIAVPRRSPRSSASSQPTRIPVPFGEVAAQSLDVLLGDRARDRADGSHAGVGRVVGDIEVRCAGTVAGLDEQRECRAVTGRTVELDERDVVALGQDPDLARRDRGPAGGARGAVSERSRTIARIHRRPVYRTTVRPGRMGS